MLKRAVITGMGVVSPLGIGADENWRCLLEQTTGIAGLTRMPTENMPVTIGAEVKNFDPKQFISDRKAVRLTFHSVHLALAAAKLAFDDSGLTVGQVEPARFGAVVGSGGGGFDDGPGFVDLNEPILRSWNETSQRFDSALFGEKSVPVTYPLFLLKALPNNAFYYISLLYNIQGENDNIVSSYTGGAQAIGDAFRAVRRGLADVIIAGGYDSLLTPNTIFSLASFNLLSHSSSPAEACRPFDRLRDGTVAGEGAGFMIVEDYEHARKRGARIYAEITGYGNMSSAFHMYNPDPGGSGCIRAMRRSLEDAGLPAERVDWLCADGIATQASDCAEAAALRAVFGDRCAALPVSGAKAVTGHMGSGSSAAECIYAVQSLGLNIIPPTANYTHPDKACPLNIVAGSPSETKLHTVMNLNQGLGGQCTAIIFQKL